MAEGKWGLVEGRVVCDGCGCVARCESHGGTHVFETDAGVYCCEACADEAESHSDSIGGSVQSMHCDYPD